MLRRFWLIFAFGVLLCACGGRHVGGEPLLPELRQAEELMFPHPDSALHVLQRMPMPSEGDRYQHATWALLLSHAIYKNYIKQNDSLVNIACDYFLPRDDAGRKGLALYVKGCVYDEANRQDEALPLLLQASEEIAKTEDYRLGHLIESRIGIIYSYRSLYDHAVTHLTKALECAEKINDSLYIAASFRYMARIPDLKKDYQESIALYKKGIDIVPSGTNAEARLYFEIASVFMHAKDYKSAIKYALGSTNINEGKYISDQAYSVLGETYYLLGMNDSAQYYMEKIKNSSNIYTARGANRLLRKISEDKLDFKSADNYADELIILLDSIRFIDRNEAILDIQEKYNNEVLVNENNQIQLKRERDIRISLVVILLLLVVIICGAYWYRRYVNKKEQLIRLYANRIKENELLLMQNQESLDDLIAKYNEKKGIENEKKELLAEINRLKEDDEKLKQDNVAMLYAIDNYKKAVKQMSQGMREMLDMTEEVRVLRKYNSYLVEQVIKENDLLGKLKKNPKSLSIGQLKEIEDEVNISFNGYRDRLTTDVPSLSEAELQQCCLMKLGFSVGEMAIIANLAPNTISKRKLHIKEQILKAKGLPSDKFNLDLWLREY